MTKRSVKLKLDNKFTNDTPAPNASSLPSTQRLDKMAQTRTSDHSPRWQLLKEKNLPRRAVVAKADEIEWRKIFRFDNFPEVENIPRANCARDSFPNISGCQSNKPGSRAIASALKIANSASRD